MEKQYTKLNERVPHWTEVVKSFEMGHSILMYQHFIREKRDDFIASILQEIHIKTGSKCIISFRTSNVVFFLVSQEKQNEYFLNKAQIVSKSWDKQIQVSPHTYP